MLRSDTSLNTTGNYRLQPLMGEGEGLGSEEREVDGDWGVREVEALSTLSHIGESVQCQRYKSSPLDVMSG